MASAAKLKSVKQHKLNLNKLTMRLKENQIIKLTCICKSNSIIFEPAAERAGRTENSEKWHTVLIIAAAAIAKLSNAE